MNDFQLILLTALGVLVSIVFPILSKYVREFTGQKVEEHGAKDNLNKFWLLIKPYVMTGLFSLVTAAIVLAFYKSNLQPAQTGFINNGWAAFLYGYTWDSTIQKISNP